MGRKEYFRKAGPSMGCPASQRRNGVNGRGHAHQPGTVRHYTAAYARADIRGRMEYISRNHLGRVGRAGGYLGNLPGREYGRNRPQKYGGRYENRPGVRTFAPAYGTLPYKEKELHAIKERMHVKEAYRQERGNGNNSLADEKGMTSPQKMHGLKAALNTGTQNTAFKTNAAAVQKSPDAPGSGMDDLESHTEELKSRMHVKFPGEADSYWKMYAASRTGGKSSRKKREDAKARGKEYYKKRKKEETEKRKKRHYNSSTRDYRQYYKEYSNDTRHQRKARHKARQDETKAQMKKAFRKSAAFHFSKALGSLSGSYEENGQRQNPYGIFSSFVSGAFKYAGKKIANTLIYVLGGVLSAVMPLLLVLLPFLLVLFLLISLFTSSVSSPELYFNGGFARETQLKSNGEFIDNAIQKHYDNLDTEIKNFAASDPKNVVVYANGYRYNKNSVLAVYFSILCTRDDYYKLYKKKNKEYPPYLFVDTGREGKLLKEIFGQMNYTKETEVSYTVITGIDPETNTPITEERTYKRLTVYNLTIGQWLLEHPGVLTKKAEGLLNLLKKYETMAYGGGNGYTPLDDVDMPEGVDENLIYMAATLKAEAGGEIEEGKIAVGFVIWNRAGGSISGVKGACLAPRQFSCWDDGSAARYLAEYTGMSLNQINGDICYRVCVAVTSGQTSNPIGTKRYYCNPAICSGGYDVQMAKIQAHNTADQIQEIGNHVFCENGWW